MLVWITLSVQLVRLSSFSVKLQYYTIHSSSSSLCIDTVNDLTPLPAWQHINSESRSLKKAIRCHVTHLMSSAALNTLFERSLSWPFWQINPNDLFQNKKTCCLSHRWWLIGSSLGRDPFRDCRMNFPARRRHTGPNVNPYHCAYTAGCPPPPPPSLPPSAIHTCNVTLNSIVTHRAAATPSAPAQSAVAIVHEQSPWTTKRDPLQICSGERGGLWRRQRGAGGGRCDVCCGPTFSAQPERGAGPPSPDSGAARTPHTRNTHTFAYSRIYVFPLTEPL